MTHHSETPKGVVLKILEEAGIVSSVIYGKHMKIRFHIDGAKCTYTVPGTTGDGRRALKNAKAGIKRLLRQHGVVVAN